MIDLRKPTRPARYSDNSEVATITKERNSIAPILWGVGIVLAIIGFVALTSFDCVCFTR